MRIIVRIIERIFVLKVQNNPDFDTKNENEP